MMILPNLTKILEIFRKIMVMVLGKVASWGQTCVSYIREEFKKKIQKSDIVHIWVWTHPTLPISDIKFSDIFSKV